MSDISAHWPLIERELLRAGRHEVTYVARAIAPVMALLMLALALVFEKTLGEQVEPESIASHISTICVLGQFGIAYLFVPWAASRALADEVRDGTLDLLRLAEKSHLELYASKLVSVWLQAIVLLLSLVPVQVCGAVIYASGSDPGFLSFSGTAIAAAVVCAVALFYSALLKRPGMAFVATLATLLLWMRLWRAIPPLGVDAFVMAIVAIAAPVGTVALLRHPDFEVLDVLRRRRNRGPLRVPTKAAACIARIVAYEGGGIATFAQSWWGRALAAAVLTLFVYSLHIPSALLIAALAGAEAFVVGRNLRDKEILSDLTVTTTGPRALATGLVRGQFRKSVVFVPAIIASFSVSSLFQELAALLAPLQSFFAADWMATAMASAILAAALVAYSLLLAYFFTAVGIHYAIAGCSTARMAGNLLALGMILSILISMITMGYYTLSQLPNLPATPPPTPFVSTLGEVVAALLVLPIAAVDYKRRIVRQFTHVPEDAP